jgi:hypothetical protein
MSDSQKQMCGCKVCLNAYSMMLALISWRGQRKKIFEMRLAILDPNSREYRKLKREFDYFLEDAFPAQGHRLWDKAKDAMYSMTCDREEGCDLVCMDCALGLCFDCPKLKLIRYKTSTDENDLTKYISWRNQFETQYKCKRHGYIDSGKCPQCQTLPVEQQPEKKPMSTMDCAANKRAPIGTFIKDVFQPFLVKLRYHIFLVTVLSKNHCVKDRAERYMKTPTGRSVLIMRDYSDHLNAAFTGW